jgi:hypothetical protein
VGLLPVRISAIIGIVPSSFDLCRVSLSPIRFVTSASGGGRSDQPILSPHAHGQIVDLPSAV